MSVDAAVYSVSLQHAEIGAHNTYMPGGTALVPETGILERVSWGLTDDAGITQAGSWHVDLFRLGSLVRTLGVYTLNYGDTPPIPPETIFNREQVVAGDTLRLFSQQVIAPWTGAGMVTFLIRR